MKNFMYKDEEILITGSNGLVGLELKKLYPNAICITHKDYDLTNENDVKYMFFKHTPKCVIHLAAKVGGVLDNIENPAVFFDQNILMNTFMVKHSYQNNVERFVGILSSCIFPDIAKNYPLELDELHNGPPTATNFSYGYAKRCLAVQIDAYNKQYGTRYNYLIPSNMYGEHDKLDPKKSHFIPSLILKIKKAILNDQDHIKLLGDGSPLRQFMHAKDLANVIKYILDNEIYENLNVANEENFSIDQMAKITLDATGNSHLKLFYEPNTPNGQHRKDISIKRLKELMPEYKFTNLADGVRDMYKNIKI
jgi:GDP-L-fucose synthase